MLLDRKILLVIIAVAAIALPFAVNHAQNAQARLQGLQLTLSQLEAQQRALSGYERHAARYRDYVTHVDSFVQAAERHDIDADHWDVHDVDIKDMFLGYPDLAGFMADLTPADRSYFIPERLAVTTKPTVTRENIVDNSRRTPEPGGLTLSLKGRFLVER